MVKAISFNGNAYTHPGSLEGRQIQVEHSYKERFAIEYPGFALNGTFDILGDQATDRNGRVLTFTDGEKIAKADARFFEVVG